MTATKYKEQFVTDVVRWGSEGCSLTQMAANCGVSQSTLHDWRRDPKKPEFQEAVQLALTLAEAHWERVGQQGTKGLLQKFVPVSWIYMMKCRYKDNWKEDNNQRVELYSEVKGMSDQEIQDTLKAIIAKKAVSTPTDKSGTPVQPETN